MKLMSDQDALVTVAQRIVAGAPENQRRSIAGYAGVKLSAATKTVTLYWKGAVPDSITAIRNSLPAGVTLTVVSAPYSQADLYTAQVKLLSAAGTDSAAGTATASQISNIGPLTEGTGLRVAYADKYVSTKIGTPSLTSSEQEGVNATSSQLASTPALRTSKTSAVDTTYEATAGVPLTTTYEPLAQRLASRQNDNGASPGWFGGSGIKSAGLGWYCSTGFGAKKGTAYVILTASHCANHATSGQYKDPTGELVGNITGTSTAYDTHVITVPSPNMTSHKVWTGGFDASTSQIPIAGSLGNFTGLQVCTSGASTGYHCNVTVQSTDGTFRTADGITHPIVDVAQVASGYSNGSGDSGGPVFRLQGGQWYAQGIIMSGTNAVTCTAAKAIAGSCYRTVQYVPINPILSNFGLTLRTGS